MINAIWIMPLLPVVAVLAWGQWQTTRQRWLRLRGDRRPTRLDWQAQAGRFTGGLASQAERTRLMQQFASAGLHHIAFVDGYLLSKLLLLLAAGALGLWWQGVTSWAQLLQPGPMLKVLFLLFLAVRLPDWLLNERIKARQARLRSAVPQALDLLTICAEAGLGLDDALHRVAAEIDTSAPEIAAEFRMTRSELLVLPERSAALRRMAERSGVREIEILASTLIQSMRYGTPLASALQMIAAECRARQVADMEQKAGNTAAKIGVPLIVLVLFPLVILMAAPAVISLIRTLGANQ